MSDPKAPHAIDPEEFDRRFEYHELDGEKPRRCQEIRQAARKLSMLVIDACPPGRERQLALTNIEQAMMWANAGIARASEFHNAWDTEVEGQPILLDNLDNPEEDSNQ